MKNKCRRVGRIGIANVYNRTPASGTGSVGIKPLKRKANSSREGYVAVRHTGAHLLLLGRRERLPGEPDGNLAPVDDLERLLAAQTDVRRLELEGRRAEAHVDATRRGGKPDEGPLPTVVLHQQLPLIAWWRTQDSAV